MNLSDIRDPLPLTPREADVVRVIQDTVDATGIAPTIRQIAGMLGFEGHGHVHRTVAKLVAKGWIEHQVAKANGLKLLHRLVAPPHRSLVELVAGLASEAADADGLVIALVPRTLIEACQRALGQVPA